MIVEQCQKLIHYLLLHLFRVSLQVGSNEVSLSLDQNALAAVWIKLGQEETKDQCKLDMWTKGPKNK